eukprot:1161827-Pelagomonas_calceolata.AAC.10
MLNFEQCATTRRGTPVSLAAATVGTLASIAPGQSPVLYRSVVTGSCAALHSTCVQISKGNETQDHGQLSAQPA